jgi:hypothetical protein
MEVVGERDIFARMKAEDREEGRSGSFFSGFVQFQERGKF